MVEEVIDQWHGPEPIFFKLRADDGNLCLHHQTSVPENVQLGSVEGRKQLKVAGG